MAENSAPKLPPIVEFTPEQLGGFDEIFVALAIVKNNAGDRAKIVEAVRETWFANSALHYLDPDKRLIQQLKRAGNVISGMRALGLLTDNQSKPALSSFGEEILGLKSNPEFAARKFATFLLRERRGIELLEAARAVRRRAGQVTKAAVDKELLSRGYAVPTNSSNSGKLRQWLGTAGVIDDHWVINEDVFADLAGVKSSEITDWRKLTPLQRTTLEILRIRADGNGAPIASPDLLDLLRQRGADFNGGQVKRDIYKPLVDNGWITQTGATKGRGAKGGAIAPTDKTLKLDVALIDGLALGALPAELQEHLGRPLPEVLKDLESTDKHIKGLALELLALKLAADCGLMPVDLRVRGVATGGAEVDLVAEGAHLHFSRWLFQCKNQIATVDLGVLAKELGMATLLRAQVVVIVTTAAFAKSVRDFARQAAETTAIQVVLLDKLILENYAHQGPIALREELHSRAVEVLTLKRSQLDEVPLE
ncbi:MULTISPECIES: restriction endonuclease [unclassified Leifsonia]|uniref:restriction endonuclease n=1 Tax=unclassified Leifsonia TaxID=2663824 RepID=UPI00039DFF4F|nr:MULTISPECIES: restriction endonuclease [unclassified Leifsonia]